MSAIKHDDDKPRMDLVPADALLQVGAVFAYGATKYSDNNWRRGMVWGRLYAASLRHLLAWHDGEDLDAESGLPHLAHTACNLLMLMACQNDQIGKDDRPPSKHRQLERQAELARLYHNVPYEKQEKDQ